ncbi:twin-arginine translocation signal domain-containing protein, partial [Bradyrhizobium sp.]
MVKSETSGLHRRRFLKGVVAAGGATMAAPPTARAQT